MTTPSGTPDGNPVQQNGHHGGHTVQDGEGAAFPCGVPHHRLTPQQLDRLVLAATQPALPSTSGAIHEAWMIINILEKQYPGSLRMVPELAKVWEERARLCLVIQDMYRQLHRKAIRECKRRGSAS